ncbi:MAG TPA: superoxide dismutase [Oxalobacteraceae bacterium]|nr:superoxide dismutase [Oxalobacteraceae bacterium]
MKSKLVGLVALSVLAVCASIGPAGETAAAQLMPRSGSQTEGSVSFRQQGDCSALDGTSAGGHFNPSGKQHGHVGAPEHHAGDMPSLKADANGHVGAIFELSGPTVAAGPNSVVGRGLIVHRDPDDFKTQPTGNSGARIACGVIVKI